MRAVDDSARHRTDHLERDGCGDRQWRGVLEGERLRRLAWTGTQADLDRRPPDPRQDIEARQSLSARIVSAGGLGCADQAEELGALRAQALDRSRQETVAPQRAGDRSRQQACPHRLGRSQQGTQIRVRQDGYDGVPTSLSVAPCSGTSRHGLAAPERAARQAQRPALTTPAPGAPEHAQAGTKERASWHEQRNEMRGNIDDLASQPVTPPRSARGIRRDGGSVFPAHANTGDPNGPVRGLTANKNAGALISMMARSKCSNQRPDTLMQDHLPPDRRKPLATRGRTIHLGRIVLQKS